MFSALKLLFFKNNSNATLIKYFKSNQRGFTLIELLIVIVIIGILAGVAISVIDPRKQQDRAKDASVKATLGKVALSTEGYVSAYGQAPSPAEFIAGLKNVKSETCTTATDNVTCTFEIEGNGLPLNCSDGWSGDGSSACLFRYERNDPTDGSSDSTQFFLYAKSHGLVSKVFKYDNTRGLILICPSEGALDSANCTTDGVD
jgi:prepilin-type N-terminal cleavage/methylation domain-containing protein